MTQRYPEQTGFAQFVYNRERSELSSGLEPLFARGMTRMEDVADNAYWAGGRVRQIARYKPGTLGGER